MTIPMPKVLSFFVGHLTLSDYMNRLSTNFVFNNT